MTTGKHRQRIDNTAVNYRTNRSIIQARLLQADGHANRVCSGRFYRPSAA